MSTNKLRLMIAFEVVFLHADDIQVAMEEIHTVNLLKSGYFTEVIRKIIHPYNPKDACSMVYIFEPKSPEDVEKFNKSMRGALLSSIDSRFEVLLGNGDLKYIYTMGELNIL